ncbi:hypothetical protein BH11VER1_BH11VER1_24560 [soil metagenome]
MKLRSHLHLALFGFILVATSCKHYSTVNEKLPRLKSDTEAGDLLKHSLRRPDKQPEVQLGKLLDAASLAGDSLKNNPEDRQARTDYNYAVGRVFEVIHEAKLQPWKKPVTCPGKDGNWNFSMTTDGKPEHDPSHFRILPADRYTFHGTLVKERTLKDGLGAPMVITSQGFDPTKFDPFIQGKSVYYGVTEVLQFEGRNCTATFLDPLVTETVDFAGHTYPVAADFTAALGLALAELNPRKAELKRLVNPDEFAASTRLARLQPYDPNKIPLLLIHGLGDSQATWAPFIESMRADPVLRQKYQVWFFTYPTGYAYPLMASMLRKQLDAVNAYYPGHKKLVVIGHSMGGMITRELITDSGMKIWDAYFKMPPEKLPVAPETRKIIKDALIFSHRPEIDRVIFASASHRGSDQATNFSGRLLAGIIKQSRTILGQPEQEAEAVSLSKPDLSGVQLKRVPNSLDALDPKNRFVVTIDTIPPVKSIPFHSLIADRGKGGNLDHTKPVSFDGLVPYWSSHLDGAVSELVIPSGHWSHQHPQGIAEINRILRYHLEKH